MLATLETCKTCLHKEVCVYRLMLVTAVPHTAPDQFECEHYKNEDLIQKIHQNPEDSYKE